MFSRCVLNQLDIWRIDFMSWINFGGLSISGDRAKELNAEVSKLGIKADTELTKDDLYTIDQSVPDQEYIDEWNRRMNILCDVED